MENLHDGKTMYGFLKKKKAPKESYPLIPFSHEFSQVTLHFLPILERSLLCGVCLFSFSFAQLISDTNPENKK